MKKAESDKNDNLKNDNNTIVFLVLRISKDSIQGKNVIEFVHKTKSLGKIKDNNNSHFNYENYLTIDVYQQDSIIHTMVIEHPLYKHVEYSGDNNILVSKYIELNKEEFFIRLQMTGDSNKIRISETLNNTSKKELAIIKL